MAETWMIISTTGDIKGDELDHCQIRRTLTETQLLAPDGSRVATSPLVEPDITFDSFSLPGSDTKFTLTITSFTSGPAHDQAIGSWATIGDDVPQGGDWTAQSSVGKAESGPPDLPIWTLNYESGEGVELNMCNIVKVGEGHYKFTEPNLGTSLSESTIFPPIFEDFEYLHRKWTVTVETNLTEGETQHGHWELPHEPTAESKGDWTAQSGIGPKGEKAAAAEGY